MSKPAARVGDIAGHGGTIILGEASVLIGGMPAARVGDSFTCPGFDGPKPHVSGNIVSGSTSVIIGGSYAARLGDPTGCGIAGVVGKGMPITLGPSKPGPDNTYTGVVAGQIGDESGFLVGVKGNEAGKNSAGLFWGQAKTYTNVAGARGEVEGSLVHAGGEMDTPIGQVGGNMDLGNVAAEGHIGALSAGISGEASAVKAKVDWETSQENPIYIGAEGETKILTAEAKVDVLLGTDGRRTGINLAVSEEVVAAKGDITGKGGFNIPIPFTDSTFTVGAKAKLGGHTGGEALGASLGVYHDKEDDKLHFSVGGEAALIFGLEIDLDIMFGIKTTPPSPPPSGVGIPMTPGSITSGFANVLIG